MPQITISSVQDKLTQQYDNATFALAVLVLAFSVLAFYPVFSWVYDD